MTASGFCGWEHIAFAAAEADRLGLKRVIMEAGRWSENHARLDEEHRQRNLQLLTPEVRAALTPRDRTP